MWKTPKYQFCQSSFVFNNLQNSKDKVLVIDTRDPDHFSSRSIAGSINLSRSKIESHLRSRGGELDLSDMSIDIVAELLTPQELNKFKLRKRVFCIVLMSESSLPEEFVSAVGKLAQHDGVSDAFSVLKCDVEDSLHSLHHDMDEKNSVIVGKKIYEILHQDKVQELYILLEGAGHFFTRYPFMEHSFDHYFPNDIWQNRLFLGSYPQAAHESVVKHLDITHVINATIECSNVFEDREDFNIKYLKILIVDESHESAHKHFRNAYEFIEDALSSCENHRVLLHCAKGKSRSATLTIMFLMKKLNWTYQQAVDYVKLRRSIIDPNDGFVKQLEEFESRKFEFLLE